MSEPDTRPSFQEHVAAISKAIVTGIACDELPDMERAEIEHLALWLASERIGQVRTAQPRDTRPCRNSDLHPRPGARDPLAIRRVLPRLPAIPGSSQVITSDSDLLETAADVLNWLRERAS